MTRETRAWRRLALAGAGTIALLVTRLFVSPRAALFHWLHPEMWSRGRPGKYRSVDETLQRLADRLSGGESRDEEIERRLHACEEHLRNLPPDRGIPDTLICRDPCCPGYGQRNSKCKPHEHEESG